MGVVVSALERVPMILRQPLAKAALIGLGFMAIGDRPAQAQKPAPRGGFELTQEQRQMNALAQQVATRLARAILEGPAREAANTLARSCTPSFDNCRNVELAVTQQPVDASLEGQLNPDGRRVMRVRAPATAKGNPRLSRVDRVIITEGIPGDQTTKLSIDGDSSHSWEIQGTYQIPGDGGNQSSHIIANTSPLAVRDLVMTQSKLGGFRSQAEDIIRDATEPGATITTRPQAFDWPE